MIFKFSLIVAILVFSYVPAAFAGDYDTGRIYKLPAHEIASHIKSTKGQKRIIMIYASWCPICVAKMPHIMDLERRKAGSVIAISVDENSTYFSRYIKKLKDVPFQIILNKGSEYKLYKSLKQFGVNEWEGVPEIILLDENNKSIGQGNYEMEYINEFLLENAP